ncbi:MAG: carbonic anhydrase [candidate division WOR-3 bacterium]
MAEGKFGTAINCMDGRVQLPVIEWTKKHYELDYVDMITEPGPEKILTEAQDKRIESIKSRVAISVNKHDSKIIVVASHCDCAGNPCSKQEHFEQIKKAIKTIKSWNFSSVNKIIGVWINEQWQVEKIAEE